MEGNLPRMRRRGLGKLSGMQIYQLYILESRYNIHMVWLQHLPDTDSIDWKLGTEIVCAGGQEYLLGI